MKLEFDRMANGGYVIDLKANSDFNLHLERMSNEEDVYIYVRGSSEGEYKFYKKVFGKVVDMDFDIPEAITPKYYRIKTSVAPTLCEVTGDVENVTGQEVKPEGGSGDGYKYGVLRIKANDRENGGIKYIDINLDNMEATETEEGYVSMPFVIYRIEGNHIMIKADNDFVYSYISFQNISPCEVRYTTADLVIAGRYPINCKFLDDKVDFEVISRDDSGEIVFEDNTFSFSFAINLG